MFEIKNIGASQILTKILIFQSFFSDGRADNAYYFFCKYSLEYMYVTFVGPTLIWKIMAVSHLIFFCALDESRFWWEWLLFKLSNRSKLMAKCYNQCINSNNSHQKILTSCITLFPIFFWYLILFDSHFLLGHFFKKKKKIQVPGILKKTLVCILWKLWHSQVQRLCQFSSCTAK